MFDAAGIKLMPCAQRGNAGIPITTVNQHFVCSYVGMAIENPRRYFIQRARAVVSGSPPRRVILQRSCSSTDPDSPDNAHD